MSSFIQSYCENNKTHDQSMGISGSILMKGLFFAVFCFGLMPAIVSAAPSKPGVAVKTPAVGDKIGRYAKKHLDLDVLVAEISSAIQATRKFEVVSRDAAVLKGVISERNLADKDVSIKGANYLLVPSVQDFIFYRESKPVPNIDDKYLRIDSGRMRVHAQVVDVSSGAVKMNFNVKASFATDKQVVNTRGGAPSRVHFTRLAKKIASRMADQLVDTAFPMLVMKVKGDKVWINRGQDGGLKNGSHLNVYRKGEELIDPYTKESLGSEEEYIGKVKIDRVNPKFTTAIYKGSRSQAIQQGDIVRKP